MADLGVEYVEQPLYKGSHEALRELKKSAPLPIFVDEDSMINADIPKLAGAVDGINIKLMKSGGLVEARRMIATARAFDFKIMIGCMIETAVAITAAAHLGPHCDYLDLDGNLLVSNDPFTGSTCDTDGTIHLPSATGLGVEPRPE
jgi:L-alanine-DL-glutamate epimerase-like enolase superfamily enzyme